MKTVIIIQARMSSTRLPGKVLLPIAGKPVLEYVYIRASSAKVNKIIITTSSEHSDDLLVSFCHQKNYPVYRGDLNDVLSRFYFIAKFEKSDVIIRVTGDCPLIDGQLISAGLKQFNKERPDYLSNTIIRTFPRGFDFEIFTFKALKEAFKKATKIPEREHVTPFIYKTHPEQFKISHFTQLIDKSNYQITVDTLDDYKLLKILIEKYHADLLNYKNITLLLDAHPELSTINSHIRRKHYGQ